jgi:hypothetical protein
MDARTVQRTQLGRPALPALWDGRVARPVRRRMPLKSVRFLAITLTALACVPAGAHLFALPNKMGLEEDAYFAVQSIYRGWALFGGVLIAAFVVNGVLAFSMRGRPMPFWLAVIGCLMIAATIEIFIRWVYPANELTRNWTAIPANWETLRQQWEYGQAANAILTFIGLCAVTGSVVLDEGVEEL